MSEIDEKAFVIAYHEFQRELSGIVLIKNVGEGMKQIYAKKGKEQLQFFIDPSNPDKVKDDFDAALRALNRIQ